MKGSGADSVTMRRSVARLATEGSTVSACLLMSQGATRYGWFLGASVMSTWKGRLVRGPEGTRSNCLPCVRSSMPPKSLAYSSCDWPRSNGSGSPGCQAAVGSRLRSLAHRTRPSPDQAELVQATAKCAYALAQRLRANVALHPSAVSLSHRPDESLLRRRRRLRRIEE